LNGQVTAFDMSLLSDVFGSHLLYDRLGRPSDIFFSATDRANAILISGNPSSTTGIGFLGFGGEQFFQGLWELAKRTNGVIYWIGGGGALASEDAVEQADPLFLEALTLTRVVSSGKDLVAWMDEYERLRGWA
jgi:hypothetical protein